MKAEIFKLLDEIQVSKVQLKQLVWDFVHNKENSLDDRWLIFKHAAELVGERKSWCVDFYTLYEGLNREVSWYDDFNLHRYQALDTIDLVYRIKGKPHFQAVNVESLKEEILERFIYSFVCDW